MPTAVFHLVELRVRKGAELTGRLPGAGLEDAAQVALIGKARVAGDHGEVSPAVRKSAAYELHAQAIHEFGHRAAIVFPKDAREVNWVHAYLRGDFFQREGLPVRFVKHFQSSIEPGRARFFRRYSRTAHGLQHLPA